MQNTSTTSTAWFALHLLHMLAALDMLTHKKLPRYQQQVCCGTDSETAHALDSGFIQCWLAAQTTQGQPQTTTPLFRHSSSCLHRAHVCWWHNQARAYEAGNPQQGATQMLHMIHDVNTVQSEHKPACCTLRFTMTGNVTQSLAKTAGSRLHGTPPLRGAPYDSSAACSL